MANKTREQLIWEYQHDYTLFPLPICFDPYEERMELYRRTERIEEHVDEMIRTNDENIKE